MPSRLFAAVNFVVVGIWIRAAKAARATMPAPNPARRLNRSRTSQVVFPEKLLRARLRHET